MRQKEEFNKKCKESDCIAFEECRKKKELSIYKCHAGLIEAISPVTEHGKIIGYLMFGQITDNKNRSEFIENMIKICKKCDIKEDITGIIKKIKYRNDKQIQAASKIMDACTGYIQLKEMIHRERGRLFEEIDKFIDEHIGEEITVERLCGEFSVSRTSLYEQMRRNIDGGIAAYIRQKKLRYAKELVKKTKIPVAEIADRVGYEDYNYFLRSFKKEFGISPKKLINSIKEREA